ncbi:hypothetical protein [Streptomyces sp. NPDC096311]|uniref:hypothetical protein n=1 Tax=Streptomyces sp. NPDC096311 TaxID=3366083 RepID=UPI00382075FA
MVADPRDDAVRTRAASPAHDLTAGRITVPPAPGTDSAVCAYDAYDLLASLG